MSRYFVKLGNEKTGPFMLPALQSMVQAGTIKPLDLVSLDGSDWRPARFIPELFNQETLLQMTSQERILPAKIPLNQDGDRRLIRKTIAITAVAALIFGFVLGWVVMFTPHARYSKMESQLAELQLENEKLLKDFSGSLTRDEHSRLANQQMELYTKQEKELRASLSDTQETFAKAKADHLQAMNRLKEDAKEFAMKAKELEKSIDPVKDLISRLEGHPELLEFLQKIQKVSSTEMEVTIKELQKSLAQSQAALAAQLRQDYRLMKTGTPTDFPGTMIRWNLITQTLQSLAENHKFNEPAISTLDDLKSFKDLNGLFILRTLSNDLKTKRLQEMLDASGEGAEKTAAGKKALEEAIRNTAAIFKAMDLDPALFIMEPVIQKPGKEPRILMDDIEKTLFELQLAFDRDSPKRLENHLEVLEKVSSRVTEFIFKYADTPDFKELQNDLNKFKIYPLLNEEMTGMTKKLEMLAKLQKSMKSLGRLPMDQLIKRLDQLYLEMEIARIAGVFPEAKAGKNNEN